MDTEYILHKSSILPFGSLLPSVSPLCVPRWFYTPFYNTYTHCTRAHASVCVQFITRIRTAHVPTLLCVCVWCVCNLENTNERKRDIFSF